MLHSSFRCTGCGSCALACPWGVIDVRLLRSVAQKCTQCAEREVKSGRKGPRCVAACASGALRFLDEAELPKAEVGRRFISRSPYWRRT
ncbi:MAG: 4Fe-4S dicluster domain-containing protein [candidate division WOR-3 bacterium]